MLPCPSGQEDVGPELTLESSLFYAAGVAAPVPFSLPQP